MSDDSKTKDRPIAPDPGEMMQEGHPAAAHYNPYLWAGSMEEGAEEGLQAHAGTALPEGATPAGEEQIVEALRSVYDPEIPVNIYDLGLIYENKISADGSVSVLMTLTAPACPVAGQMPGMVAKAVAEVEGAGEVTVTLTWEPPWTKEMMSEDAMLALGIF
ncbi:MAG: SUF system Fe-S cluster assembly protein [Rhodovibrionaceae bacterium]